MSPVIRELIGTDSGAAQRLVDDCKASDGENIGRRIPGEEGPAISRVLDAIPT
jgi:hypothetical protein